MAALYKIMLPNYKILVVIPVYNEENNMGTVLSGFGKVPRYEVLVIDDGSTDSTSEIIGKYSVKIMTHPQKTGVGSSIIDGIRYGITNGFDILVVMAGNGKDNPLQITLLLSAILNDGYDYIQGSRFMPSGQSENLPFWRFIAIKSYSIIWSILFGKRMTDVTNGFRAYKLHIFSNPEIDISQEWLNTYEFEYYLHYKVHALGYKTKEVPVSKNYPSRKNYTKIRPFLDWWRIIKPLLFLALKIRK